MQYLKFDLVALTVCIKFMEKFINRIDETHTDRTDQDGTELLLIKMCREATGKEERLVSACVCSCSIIEFSARSCYSAIILEPPTLPPLSWYERRRGL